MRSPCFRIHHARSKSLRFHARISGFTAIELMVVGAIVAVLASLAAPSFGPVIERMRVRDAAESLTASLYLARSEAIKRGGNVVIVKNDLQSTGTCASTEATDWHCGWRLFFDANGDGIQNLPCDSAKAPNECDLMEAAPSVRTAITLAGSSGALVINRWGMASHRGGANAPTNLTFDVFPKDKDVNDSSSARLCSGAGGRIARKKGTEVC